MQHIWSCSKISPLFSSIQFSAEALVGSSNVFVAYSVYPFLSDNINLFFCRLAFIREWKYFAPFSSFKAFSVRALIANPFKWASWTFVISTLKSACSLMSVEFWTWLCNLSFFNAFSGFPFAILLCDPLKPVFRVVPPIAQTCVTCFKGPGVHQNILISVLIVMLF